MHRNVTRVPEKGHDAPIVSMNSSFNGTPYLLERMAGFSILAAVTQTSGTLAGTLKLQSSNNAFADNVNMDSNANAVWVDIPNSSVAVSGSANVMWNTTDVFYESVRVVYTSSTGQGTFVPYFVAKT